MNMGLSIVYTEGPQVIFFIFSLKVAFVFAQRVDPDELLHYAAFHPSVHCLPEYEFSSH